MADFCKDCSISLFGEDFEDLADIAKEGETAFALCEGCGLVEVDKDGKRVNKAQKKAQCN